MNKVFSPCLKIFLCTFGYLFASSKISLAQVNPDGTTNTTVNPDGNNFTIENGDRAGGNLFHSFDQFSVPNGGSAVFDNATDISNIFSRVTGGNISNIDGLISANGSASLFLINPAGIIFGEGASLDIGGSFYGSTADSILFPDNVEFSASDIQAEQPILTINAPIGLGFRDNPGDINVGQSTLQVNQGETLAIIGGNLILEGSDLKAEDGRIELGSISNNSLVNLNQTPQGFGLDYGEVQNFGQIQLAREAQIETSGEAGGAIQIQGDKITLAEESVIIADTLGDENGAGINLETKQLIVKDGSQISASSVEESQGNSGGININAVESVELIGTSGQEQGNNSGGGQGNNSGGGQSNNNRTGENPSQIETDARGNGQAGDLIINTGKLSVLDGARISASTIDTPRGGNITINASESVELSGVLSERQRSGGLTTQTRGVGQAGDVIVDTKKLIIQDGAEISASTFGEGDGGSIILTATESIEVTGISEEGRPSGIIAETGNQIETRRAGVLFGTGNGGNLTISTGKLLVQDGAKISVSSNESDLGSAGNLEITTSSIELNQGEIEAETAIREGGNITLRIDDNLTLRNSSTITAKAFQDANGGNINIDTNFIVAFPKGNNDIIANAFSGNGGNITINAQAVFGIAERPRNPFTNDINASSARGAQFNGNVILNLSDVNVIQGATELPTNIVVPEQTTTQACQSDRETAAKNAFTIKGKGGIIPAPDLPLNSQNITINGEPVAISPNTSQPISTSYGDIMPARGAIKTEDRQVILTSYRTNSSGDRLPENSISECIW